MILIRKVLHVFALLFLVVSIASCQEECISADEFDTYSTVIYSNPVNDGIFGTYDSQTGGQRASWHDTGLRANGSPLLIQVEGAWVSLEGEITSTAEISEMDRCNFCAKRYDNSSPNCICYLNQTPTAEKGIDGQLLNFDCSVASNQEDPARCTCTRQHGAATDYGTYHFPLNLLTKSEVLKVADEQTNCKYDRGMGAYISLWGSSGVSTPLRAYHLFSEEEICNITRDSQGRCLDDSGKDVTRYVFRSANGVGLLKDDGQGNHTTDSNTGNDQYHRPNEKLKTIMYDSYYSDNSGYYNVRILGGVGDENEPGLLEFLVSLIEEVLLGEINDDGQRQGGLIEFLYKGIVQDSGFATIVQVCLSLYIALFGAAHLFGVVEISSKKEIMNRVLKISLIMFFISDNSWYFYNKIVVSFFKDSMDYVVSFIMDLQDSYIDPTSMIQIAQMERAEDASNATRFSYIDLIIRNLMSGSVSTKIWGLFFNSIFGFIYIALIYALIFGFIYVMLYAASMYVSNLIKIIFVLALGPIFMIFTLFSKTSQMFKNWLGFLGGRSMEVIVIFTVLYLFVSLIDRAFTDMLYYSVCGVNQGIGPIKLIILEADIDRSFIEWMISFISIAALLFITYMVLQQVPSVVSSIVSIGGVGGGSGSGMAKGLMSGMMTVAGGATSGLLGAAGTLGRYGVRGATHALRKSGVADAIHSVTKHIPIPNPRAIYRNAVIDGAIAKAKKEASNLSGKDRDTFIRDRANKELQLMMQKSPNHMAFAGLDMYTMANRFDKKLALDPLKKFIKKEAKNMKRSDPNGVKFGKEAQDALKNKAKEWAKNNLAEGDGAIGKYLDSSGLNKLINKKTELSASRASSLFAGDEKNKNRYLDYLRDKQAEKYNKHQEKIKQGNSLSAAYSKYTGRNLAKVERDFLRKAWHEENDRKWYQKRSFLLPDALKEDRLNTQKAMLRGDINSGKNAEFARDRLRKLALKGSNMDPSTAKTNQDVFDITARMAGKGPNSELKHAELISGYINGKERDLALMSEAERLAESSRLMELARMGGIGPMVDASNQQLNAVSSITDKYETITDANIDAAKNSAANFVAQDFTVQFGQPITQALLQESDLGLKASNVALGVAVESADSVSASAISGLQVSKNQLSTQMKISKMNKQIKEFELQELKAKKASGDTGVDNDIKAIEKEIYDYEKEISRTDNEVSRLDSEISSHR